MKLSKRTPRTDKVLAAGHNGTGQKRVNGEGVKYISFEYDYEHKASYTLDFSTNVEIDKLINALTELKIREFF